MSKKIEKMFFDTWLNKYYPHYKTIMVLVVLIIHVIIGMGVWKLFAGTPGWWRYLGFGIGAWVLWKWVDNTCIKFFISEIESGDKPL